VTIKICRKYAVHIHLYIFNYLILFFDLLAIAINSEGFPIVLVETLHVKINISDEKMSRDG
jgi:hypothetical protein